MVWLNMLLAVVTRLQNPHLVKQENYLGISRRLMSLAKVKGESQPMGAFAALLLLL